MEGLKSMKSKGAHGRGEEMKDALRLLYAVADREDKRRIFWLALVYSLISVLDLIGLYFIAVFTLLLVETSERSAQTLLFGNSIRDLSEVFGSNPAAIIGSLGAFFLLSKSFASFFILRLIYSFLGKLQGKLSELFTYSYFNLEIHEIVADSPQRASFLLSRGVGILTLGILGPSIAIVAESALLVTLSVVLLVSSPGATVISLLFLGLAAFAIQASTKSWIRIVGQAMSSSVVRGETIAHETLASYRQLFVLNRLPEIVQKVSGFWTSGSTAQAESQMINQVPKLAYEVVLVLSVAVFGVLQFYLSSDSAIGPTVAIFLVSTARMIPSILRLNSSLISIQTSAAELRDFSILLWKLARRPAFSAGARNLDSESAIEGPAFGLIFEPSMKLVDVSVSFGGDPEDLALKEISLEIKPGTRCAIVGETGAGKSTLLDVILGIRQPDAGTVTVSGTTPKNAIVNWPGKIALVPQKVGAFDGTIAENVAFGIPLNLIEPDRVLEALRAARLEMMAEDFKADFEHQIVNSSRTLSGGELQRLGLARALYSQPELLVLDEVTSSVDSVSEAEIRGSIVDLGRTVSVIAVSHSLPFVAGFDRFVYLEQGRLISQGTMSEVRREVSRFDKQLLDLGL